MSAKPQDKIDPVDRHVGLEIRRRRRLMRMSQSALAENLGVTFQQIQKYELGVNRVSCSALYKIARALGTSCGSFFAALEESAPNDGFRAHDAAIQEAALLIPSICKIPDLPKHGQEALRNVIDAMALN